MVAYLFLVTAGVMFLQVPAVSVAAATEYNALLKIWSCFYIAGGAFAALSVIARTLSRRLVSFWYLEAAGLMLIISANIVYGYALTRTGITNAEFNVIALSMVVFAFTGSLIGRTVDAYRYAKILTKLNDEAHAENSKKES